MKVLQEFHTRTGSAPSVLGSAPGRVNLIGEHLDYNGGRSLPIALAARTYVAGAPRTDGLLVVESLQAEGRVEVPIADLGTRLTGWAAYVAGVVWALDQGGPGCTLLVDGQVPSGSGLSSSAALECAVAVTVTALSGATPSRSDLVAACVRAENDYVGAPTGSMDQTVSVFAQPGHALLIDFAGGSHRYVPWDPPGELVVIDTRASHALVGGEYAERRAQCEAAATALGADHLATAEPEAVEQLGDPVLRRRARHVVTEVVRVAWAVEALETGDWVRFGRLMTESHLSLRDDFEVSCRELDVAVDAALASGALGARMTGGGFGGSAIALAPPGRARAVRDAVSAAYASEGLRPPGFVDGPAGGPASAVSVPTG